MNEPKQQPAIELDEAEVAAYLEAHPDFLQRHPQVLDALEFHHESGAAVSLIEHQVVSLRRDNKHIHSKLKDLIATARENELRVQHLNGLAQVLLAAADAAELVDGLRDFLHRELAVDAIYIGVVGGPEVAVGGIQALTRESTQMAALTNAFRRGKPLCGPLDEGQVSALFQASGDTPPQSAALVPMGTDKVRGVLVLGSRDSKRFVPEMGTLFLELMGTLVTAACRRHLGANKL